MTAQEFQTLSAQTGLKPKALGAKLGYSTETISRWRQGRVRISHRAAIKLYRLLGLQCCPTCRQPLPSSTRLSR